MSLLLARLPGMQPFCNAQDVASILRRTKALRTEGKNALAVMVALLAMEAYA